MPKFVDLTGKRFGAWSVVARAPNRGAITMYICTCSCGAEKHVQAGHLTSGASTNCGCVRKPTKHGGAVGAFTKKYKTWRQIKARCCNPKHKNADIYNGLLCTQWFEFAQFDADVPEPPNDAATIDRIDNAKGYEPGNIRWVTMAEQHRNQRNCRWIEHEGRRQLLTDWAKEMGVTISTLHERIKKWGIQKALSR